MQTTLHPSILSDFDVLSTLQPQGENLEPLIAEMITGLGENVQRGRQR